MLKYLYIFLGIITLTLGLLGIFTPGLPTTPFLLLTAFLFSKSSPKLHQKLLDNKVTGRYIKRINGGLSTKALCFSILFMWCMVLFSAFVVFDGKMRFVMLGLGCIGSIAQFMVFRRKKKKEKSLALDKSKSQE